MIPFGGCSLSASSVASNDLGSGSSLGVMEKTITFRSGSATVATVPPGNRCRSHEASASTVSLGTLIWPSLKELLPATQNTVERSDGLQFCCGAAAAAGAQPRRTI